jgi:sulfatase modifying factor 1
MTRALTAFAAVAAAGLASGIACGGRSDLEVAGQPPATEPVAGYDAGSRPAADPTPVGGDASEEIGEIEATTGPVVEDGGPFDAATAAESGSEGGDAGAETGADADAAPDALSTCGPGGPGLTNCGPGGSGDESCCASPEVTGGTFYRSYDDVTYVSTAYPATVSTFRLDRYEVTVGRFRQFVDAVVAGWRPAAGSGKHTHLNGGRGLAGAGGGYETGWDASWTSLLATTSSAWTTNLSCQDGPTWTAAPGQLENEPINCQTWQEAYAFCIWDGGFLPSEAEWNYAAAGGGGPTGQRVYPWSSPSTSTTIDCSHALTYGCFPDFPDSVGSTSPAGDGAFGQADLAGNVWEWTADSYSTSYASSSCVDCVDLSPATGKALRGGAFWDGTEDALAAARASFAFEPSYRSESVGVRCARTP